MIFICRDRRRPPPPISEDILEDQHTDDLLGVATDSGVSVGKYCTGGPYNHAIYDSNAYESLMTLSITENGMDQIRISSPGVVSI
jgi:hypothetical protein